MLSNRNSLAFSAHPLQTVTFVILLLSSVSLLYITMTDAAPTRLIPGRSPVISAILGGRGGLSIGIGAATGDGDGSGLLLSLHRPIGADESQWPQKEKRRFTADKRVLHDLGSKAMDRRGTSQLYRGNTMPRTARPSTDHLKVEKRHGHSNMQGYVPCGPGSGATYDKGLPYGR
ncbi:hypothetical protein EDD21DRAFT_442466 [Dissophora ornata]|nr:hypothetical protein EDD21DRAFT_442466 [Dissophora ornata]